ncbi:acetate CoA/acetoacetate CoA-transferase beta subunit [Candidatus Gastranaerophilus sp. (ex Termes propinquus)]|nr:acetate CoA/acetoacetate CoA-transferase beta subunit [Candidatus Gastranaerophilus sp. (ex Termes propinquus)]
MELTQLSKEQTRETIAKRAAKEFKEGDIVTLGIGLPTLVANYVPESLGIMFQTENGLLGVGKSLTCERADKRVTNAGGACVDTVQGACFYDSQTAFMMMRGGHTDVTVLGALQVDQEGSLASWMIPGKLIPGMGGSMDLIIGAKKVIVAMEHTSKDEIKIVKKCTLPLTAYQEVDLIITEKCVFKVETQGLVLVEINPLFSLDDIKATTDADFVISPDLKNMEQA